MEKNIEDILKDLIRIDNIAAEVNEKRKIEVDVIEEEYRVGIEELERQLEEDKAIARSRIESAIAQAQKEAFIIEEEKQETIRALDKRYNDIKKEILSRTINKIFDVEMGSKWML